MLSSLCRICKFHHDRSCIWTARGDLIECAKFQRYIPKGDHRALMAEAIGRPLRRLEFVHHVNGVHRDNRIENLCICSPREHFHIHRLMRRGYSRQDAINQIIVEQRFMPNKPRKGKGRRLRLGEILRLSKLP